MKKFISIFMALAIVMCMAVPTFAATLDNTNKSGNAIVYYKTGPTSNDRDTTDPTDDVVDGTYTVVIPELIEAKKSADNPTAENVIASNVLIPYNTKLYVGVTYGELSTTNSKVKYELQKSDDGNTFNQVLSGSTVLLVPAGYPSQSFTSKVKAVVTGNPLYSGNYSDTATFNLVVA